jgi:hypothetical protein
VYLFNLNRADMGVLADSKLRAHLEDARQENKRAVETCRSHMEELDERRNVMAELDRSRRNERDSLVAANAQVASLRAQLERAVDAKVNKKMNNKLKVGSAEGTKSQPGELS